MNWTITITPEQGCFRVEILRDGQRHRMVYQLSEAACADYVSRVFAGKA